MEIKTPMKSLLNLLLITLLLIFYDSSYSQNIYYDKVKITIASSEDLQRISELGIALDGTYIKKNQYIVGEFKRDEIDKIKNAGYTVELLIADVSKYYEKRNQQAKDTSKKKIEKNAGCFVDKYPTPNYFTLGSVGGYYSYNEIVAQLDSMHIRFPDLVTAKQAFSPVSIEGRNLWYVKISDNPSTNENEPKILFTSLAHAREPMGMQQLFYFMYYLLENYDANPSVKYLVDNLELYFIPCVNPDGYVRNSTTNPNGGGMHRKNCRQTGASNIGVDLNRNYGFMWGFDNVGSSPNIESDTYRGTSPFSEPETQAIKSITESKQFIIVIDYHCYGNVLLYPWGYINDVTPDNQTFRAFSDLMTRMNGFFYGTPMEGIGYNANGGSFDWFYGEQTTKPKILAWSPEAGNPNDGFYPASNRIESIAKSFMEMNLYVARFATKYIDVTDKSNRFLSGNEYLKYNLYNIGIINNPVDFNLSFIPISTGLTAINSTKQYSGFTFLQQKLDSIQIQIDSNISDGTILKYLYKIQTSQGYYLTDTFTFVKGIPITLFTETGSNMNQWTSTTWNTTSLEYYSPPKSITDSPNGNYPENTTRIITQSQNISLVNALYAELSFWTKWDIEPLADYVQIQISTNNGTTWQPLCGQFSQPSFLSGTSGQPIYEGNRNNWIQERIILNDYLGQNIKIRFILKSTFSYTMQNDGFYFDDMLIQIIQNTSGVQDNDMVDLYFSVYPNPTSHNLNVNYSTEKNAVLKIYSILGQEIKKITLDATKKHEILSLHGLSGVYFVWIENEKGRSKPKKIIVE